MREGSATAAAGPEDPGLAAFQQRYFAAWDACDLDRMADCLADDFAGTFAGPAGTEPLRVDRDGVLELMRASFARVRGESASWRRGRVATMRRGPDEAVAALRVDALFPAHPEWNNAEITIETYRRGADGLWRLARVHSERLR